MSKLTASAQEFRPSIKDGVSVSEPSEGFDTVTDGVKKLSIPKTAFSKAKSRKLCDVQMQSMLVYPAFDKPKHEQRRPKNTRIERNKEKKIVRPSDSNHKLSRYKKSVLASSCQVAATRQEVHGSPVYQTGTKTSDGDPEPNGADHGASENDRLPLCSVESYRKLIEDSESDGIDALVTDLISGLKYFQDRLYHRDEIKAKVRQRMYYGLKETMKQMDGNKVKLIVIAGDLQSGPGGLDKLVEDLLEKAKFQKTPAVCALTRKKLKTLTQKPSKISCIAVADPSGKEDQFAKIIEKIRKPVFFGNAVGNSLKDEDNRKKHLESWTSTTRRGRFAFAVDKLF